MVYSEMSSKGEEALILEEGEPLRAYRCPAGVLTIGVGLTTASGVVKVTPGMTISKSQSRTLLKRALAKNYIPRVVKQGLNISQNLLDGSTMFDFNTGAIHRASWVKKYKARQMSSAENSFKAWNKGGGRVLRGLVKRRNHEWDIIEHNRYPRTVGVSAINAPSSSNSVDDVKAFQQQLAKLGYNPGKIDGVLGSKTESAIKSFQKDHGLTPDGIVGPATRATLKRVKDKKAQNKASGAGAVGGGAGGGGTDVVMSPEGASIDTLLSMLGWSIAVAVIVGGCFLIWRYRGPLFEWLPESIKDAFEDRGIVIGRRVRI